MAETRVEHWKRKLLDLSLRNPLLNATDGNKFLPLNEGTPYAGGAATTAVVPYTPPEAGEPLSFKTRLPEKEIRKWLKELVPIRILEVADHETCGEAVEIPWMRKVAERPMKHMAT